jgi:hypothetical protein
MDSEAARRQHIEAMRTYPEDCGCEHCESARRASAGWRRFGQAMFAHFRSRDVLTRFSFALSRDTLIAGRFVAPLPKADNDR